MNNYGYAVYMLLSLRNAKLFPRTFFNMEHNCGDLGGFGVGRGYLKLCEPAPNKPDNIRQEIASLEAGNVKKRYAKRAQLCIDALLFYGSF